MKIFFRAGATTLIENFVEKFNQETNLDIKIVVNDEDEVTSVTLTSKKITASQIFDLGLRYGMLVEQMRAQGHKDL